MSARAAKEVLTKRTVEDSDGGTVRTGLRRSHRKNNNTDKAEMGAGTSQQPDLNTTPILENITSLKPAYNTSYTQTTTLPEKPDPRGKCPGCSSLLKPVLDIAGCTTSLLQCPAAQKFCEQCLYPCSVTSDQRTITCTNKSCQVVSMLLNCDKVTDPLSRVKGCPMFRACPKCHSLMMHSVGCKYIKCTKCLHIYCFICLRSKKRCTAVVNKYWSLTCSKPRAARQRFQT